MRTRVMTLKDGRVVRIINDGDLRVVRLAQNDEHVTTVWRFKGRWMHMMSNGRHSSMVKAIESAIIWSEFQKVR